MIRAIKELSRLLKERECLVELEKKEYKLLKLKKKSGQISAVDFENQKEKIFQSFAYDKLINGIVHELQSQNIFVPRHLRLTYAKTEIIGGKTIHGNERDLFTLINPIDSIELDNCDKVHLEKCEMDFITTTAEMYFDKLVIEAQEFYHIPQKIKFPEIPDVYFKRQNIFCLFDLPEKEVDLRNLPLECIIYGKKDFEVRIKWKVFLTGNIWDGGVWAECFLEGVPNLETAKIANQYNSQEFIDKREANNKRLVNEIQQWINGIESVETKVDKLNRLLQ